MGKVIKKSGTAIFRLLYLRSTRGVFYYAPTVGNAVPGVPAAEGGNLVFCWLAPGAASQTERRGRRSLRYH